MPTFVPLSLLRNLSLTTVVIGCLSFSASLANASAIWTWSYSGSGIAASGTLTTLDTPDASGGYLITEIAGTRDGVRITGLQPAGTAVPGNEPFGVDNLVFAGPGPQLTGNGFGYSIADGNFANPFYADFLDTPTYLEFFSAPPFTPGEPGPEDTELPVTFSATLVSTPEPASGFLLLSCIPIALSLGRWIARRT